MTISEDERKELSWLVGFVCSTAPKESEVRKSATVMLDKLGMKEAFFRKRCRLCGSSRHSVESGIESGGNWFCCDKCKTAWENCQRGWGMMREMVFGVENPAIQNLINNGDVGKLVDQLCDMARPSSVGLVDDFEDFVVVAKFVYRYGLAIRSAHEKTCEKLTDEISWLKKRVEAEKRK